MADRHKFVVSPSINHIIRCRSHRLSQRWPFRSSDCPDLEQGMRAHLIERWDCYDSDRGSLQMFVEAVLSTWELQQLRNSNRLKRQGQRRTRPLGSVPESQLSCRAWRELEYEIEARDLLRRCLERLDPDEQTLLRLVVDHGERGAAEAVGATRHQIRQRMDEIRIKCGDLKENGENPDRS